jgi:hypothetical protein
MLPMAGPDHMPATLCGRPLWRTVTCIDGPALHLRALPTVFGVPTHRHAGPGDIPRSR